MHVFVAKRGGAKATTWPLGALLAEARERKQRGGTSAAGAVPR